MSQVTSVHPVPHANVKEGDRITIFLRECRIDLFVGAYDYEKLKRQPLVITLEVEAGLPHHYQDLEERSLDRVIDYSLFYDFLQKELPKMGHIPLLETVAEQIIAFCFRDSRILKVRVRLEKPGVFEGTAGAGIEVCRLRPTTLS